MMEIMQEIAIPIVLICAMVCFTYMMFLDSRRAHEKAEKLEKAIKKEHDDFIKLLDYKIKQINELRKEKDV